MTTPRRPRPASAMKGYAAPRLRVVTWWAGRRGLRTDMQGNGRAGRMSVRTRAHSVMGVAAPMIDYRHGFHFDLSPEQLWERIEEVDQFERWWPWLSECELEGSGLTQGSVLHGVVAPPLPYRMRLRVELGECVRPHSIDATVGGDLTGVAGLSLRPREEGTWAEVCVEHRDAPAGHAAGQPVRPSPPAVGTRPGGRTDRRRLQASDRALRLTETHIRRSGASRVRSRARSEPAVLCRRR